MIRFSRPTPNIFKSQVNRISKLTIFTSLVVVSNTAASQVKEDWDPREVLAQRFPNSLIDEFSLLDGPSNSELPSLDSFSMGKQSLYERSNVLLDQLCKSRKSRNSLKVS